MAQYQDPAAADALRYLRDRIDAQQRQIDLLVAAQGQTVLPRGDHVNYPTPYEGQVMVNHESDQPYHYARQEWRPFGGKPVYAMISAVSSMNAGLPPDVIGGFDATDFPPTDGYSSDPSVLEPDDTAIGIRVHQPGFIIASCRALGWDRFSGSGPQVYDAVKGSVPGLLSSDYLGVSYAISYNASSVSGSSVSEGDMNTLGTDSFILTADDVVLAVVEHSATVDAYINQLDVHCCWFAEYPGASGQFYTF